MAVKGKKKSQSRGSQGRRRPAAAPRTAYASRPRDPWYRTTLGWVIAGVVLLAIIIGVVIFLQTRPDTTSLTQQRNNLDTYTGDIRSLLQSVTPAATDENAIPNNVSAKQAKAVNNRSDSWLSQLAQAQSGVGKVRAPTPTTQSANILFAESIQLYAQAANLYQLTSETSPAVRARLLTSAGNLRNQATALWQEGVNLLDQARSDAKMVPSGIRLPTAGAVAPPSPTPSASGGGSNKKNKKGKKNGKGSGGGNGSK